MGDPGELDQALLNPTRLSIVSLLAATRWAEFGYVRDSVGLTDSALSKQVSALDKLGYVESDKGYIGKRPRTWLNLTSAGREALTGHIRALQLIASAAGERGAGYHSQDAEHRPGRRAGAEER
ncbi:winged helix-turn-helix domain-containing protein [Nocardiopsis flavescens]|uniref:winged helix-turn-helix domain-containing protein n=1 Tax=Nocardiopsis flavescens TaxID=758803 RepID=UPI003664CD37